MRFKVKYGDKLRSKTSTRFEIQMREGQVLFAPPACLSHLFCVWHASLSYPDHFRAFTEMKIALGGVAS